MEVKETTKKTTKRHNTTGIPDTMKERFETYSGFSFDHIQVHYHSDQPKQFHANAYTQGEHIYIAPQQERVLSHELGHVIQQKQGNIQPNMQFAKWKFNTQDHLEKEADHLAHDAMAEKKPLPIRKEATNHDIIQRSKAAVQSFFRRFSIANPSDFVLYTHVLYDGLGDAGQIGFLRQKMREVLTNRNIRLHTFVDYDNAEKAGIIQSLSGADVCLPADFTNHPPIEGIPPIGDPVRRFFGFINDWEIQYPVPDGSTPLRDNLLKVKEMGEMPVLPNIQGVNEVYEKTGELSDPSRGIDGIGYGIPVIPMDLAQASMYFNKWVAEIPELEIIPSEEFMAKLSTAWIISAKVYRDDEGQGFTSDMMEDRIKQMVARDASCKMVILLGDSNHLENMGNVLILHHKGLGNAELRFFMNAASNGMIISGGEGLYAESLGTQNLAAPVLAGRYRYQYHEIADALLKMDEREDDWAPQVDDEAQSNSRKRLNKYRVFQYRGTFYYYCDMSACDLVAQNMYTKQVEIFDQPIHFKYGGGLSAFYFPASLNGNVQHEMPPVFKNDFDAVKQVFLQKKTKLQQTGNWFSLIDAGIHEGDAANQSQSK